MDNIDIHYLTNAQIVNSISPRLTEMNIDNVLAIYGKTSSEPLEFAESEVVNVLSYFHEKQILLKKSEQTLINTFLSKLPQANLVHIAAHGSANPSKPYESQMQFSDQETLALSDLGLIFLDRTRLVILSACETALPGTQLPDEVISLPARFLYSGACGVIGTMWLVDDVSTSMLMARFYDNWKQKQISPAKSLRLAQLWLRDSTGTEKRQYFSELIGNGRQFSDTFIEKILKNTEHKEDYKNPFFWGAFSYFGL